MPARAYFLPTIAAILAVLIFSGDASALHLDVLVQNVDGKLATGTGDFDNNADTIGARVFNRNLPAGWSGNNPGFNSIGSSTGTVPAGSSPLPGLTDLMWDFLPMKVGAVTSNLLYWNGVGDTPTFGALPGPDFSLSLFGKNNARAAADGTGQLIPGQVINTTASDGFLHIHRFFFLDNDHDDNNATVAPEGVYLVAMRFRMAGLNRSDPFYIAFGSPNASTTSLSAAASWVTDRVDQLAPNFSADFDGDLDVDGADFLAWQHGVGVSSGALQIDGDADNNFAINAEDLAAWRAQFGVNLATFPGAPAAVTGAAAVPEPTVAPALRIGLLLLFRLSRRGCRSSIAVGC